MLNPTALARFEAKFTKSDGCWEWTAAKFRSGHGAFSWRPGGERRAHRLSYIQYVGEIPEGMVVCHTCDNPPCVRPGHLFVGTQADNLADMRKKGRGAQGETNGTAKLTEADVLAIRSDPRPQRAIAASYGITHPAVGKIKRRETWRHVA